MADIAVSLYIVISGHTNVLTIPLAYGILSLEGEGVKGYENQKISGMVSCFCADFFI